MHEYDYHHVTDNLEYLHRKYFINKDIDLLCNIQEIIGNLKNVINMCYDHDIDADIGVQIALKNMIYSWNIFELIEELNNKHIRK